MSKYKYTEFERQINSVLSHQSAALSEIHFLSTDRIDACISSSEELLQKLGYKVESPQKDLRTTDRKIMVVPSWERLCIEAERHVGTNCELESKESKSTLSRLMLTAT